MTIRRRLREFVLATIVGMVGAVSLFAQDPAAPEKPADAPPATPSAKKAAPQKNKDNAAESADDQPKWDPQKAEKDIQVGQY
jgi:hypothetical protein